MGWQKICSLKKRQIPQALEDLFHQGMHGCVLKVSFMWGLNLNGVYEYVGQSIFKLLMSYDIRARAVKTAKNIGNWNFSFPPTVVSSIIMTANLTLHCLDPYF